MIHMSANQYPALKAFSALVKRELTQREMNKEVSNTTFMIGLEYGFCKDEILQIIDNCYDELVRLGS